MALFTTPTPALSRIDLGRHEDVSQSSYKVDGQQIDDNNLSNSRINVTPGCCGSRNQVDSWVLVGSSCAVLHNENVTNKDQGWVYLLLVEKFRIGCLTLFRYWQHSDSSVLHLAHCN